MNTNYNRWDGTPPMNSKEQIERNRVAGCGGFDNPFSPTYRNPLENPYSFESLKARNRIAFALKHNPQLKRQIEHFAKNSDRFKISPLKINGRGFGNRGTTSGQIMAGALLLGAGTVEIPPIAVAFVVGGTIIAGAIIVWNKITGFGDPKKWSYSFRHHTQEPGYNPPQPHDPNEPKFDFLKGWKKLAAGGFWIPDFCRHSRKQGSTFSWTNSFPEQQGHEIRARG